MKKRVKDGMVLLLKRKSGKGVSLGGCCTASIGLGFSLDFDKEFPRVIKEET